MMIGLVRDTFQKDLYSAQQIIKLKADTTRIYPLLVIKNTQIEKFYKAGYYHPLLLADAVEQTAKLCATFEENHVKILKVGLHPSAEIQDTEERIAGPFHISF